MGLWSLTSAWKARPELVIDPSGLMFCRAKAHLDWTEVAMVDVQEWQGNFDLKHRLIVRAAARSAVPFLPANRRRGARLLRWRNSRSSTTGCATAVQKSGPCVRSGVAPVRGHQLVGMSS
jgi:hypothetical protein